MIRRGLKLQHSPRTAEKGVTLVDLLFAVMIVAILAAIAIPAYQDSLQKARRADARAALTQIQLEQAKLRVNCRFYGQALGDAGACGATSAVTVVRGSVASPSGHYRLTIEAGSASENGYIAVAEAFGAQAGDADCTTLKLEVGPAFPDGRLSPASCF